jgi:hypothetical protein
MQNITSNKNKINNDNNSTIDLDFDLDLASDSNKYNTEYNDIDNNIDNGSDVDDNISNINEIIKYGILIMQILINTNVTLSKNLISFIETKLLNDYDDFNKFNNIDNTSNLPSIYECIFFTYYTIKYILLIIYNNIRIHFIKKKLINKNKLKKINKMINYYSNVLYKILLKFTNIK